MLPVRMFLVLVDWWIGNGAGVPFRDRFWIFLVKLIQCHVTLHRLKGKNSCGVVVLLKFRSWNVRAKTTFTHIRGLHKTRYLQPSNVDMSFELWIWRRRVKERQHQGQGAPRPYRCGCFWWMENSKWWSCRVPRQNLISVAKIRQCHVTLHRLLSSVDFKMTASKMTASKMIASTVTALKQ